MRRTITLFIGVTVFSLCLFFTGCSVGVPSSESSYAEPSEVSSSEISAADPSQMSVDTTVPTAISSSAVPSRSANICSGYWCWYNGGSRMTAFTFSDEVLSNGKLAGHTIGYDVKNNTVSQTDAQDNNYRITDTAVLVTGDDGSVLTLLFADDENALIENRSKTEKRYIHFDEVPDYDALKKIAPVPETPNDVLENGIWVKYSPQADLFDAYEFKDGIIEHKTYSFENGHVAIYNLENNYTFMTYSVSDSSVTILDDKGKEWKYYFTGNQDVMERTYEDTLGRDTYTVTERIYHHDSLPSYETVKSQSEKRG